MNNIEIIFFEEYKKLDNLCKDLLGATDSFKRISTQALVYVSAQALYTD